ncbi:MAG: nitrilase-related carbon-nitrogen hydrolase [Halopenitus sp.]
MRLACAQLSIEGTDLEGNLSRALNAIDDAAERGADVVAFPEIFDVGYFAFDSYAQVATGLDGEKFTRIADRAADRDVAVLAGTMVEDLSESAAAGFDVPAEEGLANTAVLFDADGERQLVYRKHHLFGYGSAEDELLVSGESLPTAELGEFTVAVTTCYDLRFPALYREFLEQGVDLFLVPSAWPYPRVEHWKTLPRARAIENLAYVAAINGSAAFDDAELVGRTTVYDPWGTPKAASDGDPALVETELDPTEVGEVREEFPSLRDRRL